MRQQGLRDVMVHVSVRNFHSFDAVDSPIPNPRVQRTKDQLVGLDEESVDTAEHVGDERVNTAGFCWTLVKVGWSTHFII